KGAAWSNSDLVLNDIAPESRARVIALWVSESTRIVKTTPQQPLVREEDREGSYSRLAAPGGLSAQLVAFAPVDLSCFLLCPRTPERERNKGYGVLFSISPLAFENRNYPNGGVGMRLDLGVSGLLGNGQRLQYAVLPDAGFSFLWGPVRWELV